MNGWVVVLRTRIYQFQNLHLKGIIGHTHRGFLSSVELARDESLQRLPLEKRSLLSLIKGVIGPIVYIVNEKDGGSGGGTSNGNGKTNNNSDRNPSGGGAKQSGGESTVKDGKEGKEKNKGNGKKESKEEKNIYDEKMKKEVASKPSIITNVMHQAT